MFKNKIINKFIALFMAFLIVFTVTNVNYSKAKCLKVYGADIGIIVGGGIAIDTVVKWTLALLTTMGVTGYALENKEDIKETAKNISVAYNQYLIDEKNATVQSGRYYADIIDNALVSAQNSIDKGVNKGITISNDIYDSFKSFLNDYIFSDSSDSSYEYEINPDITNWKVTYKRTYNGKVYDDYLPQNAGAAIKSYGGSVLGVVYFCSNTLSSGHYYGTLCMYYKNKDGSVHSVPDSKSFWVDNHDLTSIYASYPVIKIPVNGGGSDISVAQNNFIENYESYNFSFGSSIPNWKKGLIDNNDIIDFGSRTHITDNYDVIYPGSAVVDHEGNIVGKRAVNLPSVDAYQKLLNRYHNGELSYQELMDALQKLIGVTSLDNPGVIVRENDLVIPGDTPVVGGVGVDDKVIEDSKPIRKVIEDEQEQEMLKDDSFKGFPDLSTIFPFCIPFDLVRVLKLLVAEPETPYFEIPFKYDKIGLDYTFVIDFNQFSNLAMITRAFFIIIYIIALILLTRRIIRG